MNGRYDNVAVALHWILVVGILCQIALGLYLNEVPRGTPARTVWVNFHKSVGITLGVLILFRLYWRLAHRPPPLPDAMPRWERVAARLNHALLYACMVGLPVAGYIASNFSKFGIKYFNVVELKPWGVDDRRVYEIFNGTHKVLAVVFVALIALHVAAALKHVAIDRDGLLRRMWFERRPPA
jgi:cytochrome b561